MCIEEDINVPFIVRGPDVGRGKTTDLVTGHVDIVPTILKLAGSPGGASFDGKADGSRWHCDFRSHCKTEDDENAQTSRSEERQREFQGPHEFSYDNTHLLCILKLVLIRILRTSHLEFWGPFLMEWGDKHRDREKNSPGTLPQQSIYFLRLVC